MLSQAVAGPGGGAVWA